MTIGEFVGGTPGSSNLIPSSAYMKGTMRSLKEEVRQQIKKRMIEISTSIGQAFGAKVTIDFTNGCCSNEIDQTVTRVVQRGTRESFSFECSSRSAIGSSNDWEVKILVKLVIEFQQRRCLLRLPILN